MAVNFFNEIGVAVNATYTKIVDAGEAAQKGLLVLGEKGSRIVYEIYSTEGFEKFDKAFIANIRALSLLPSCQGVFDHCLKTLEAQRDLIYATMVIKSTAGCIKKNDDGTYYFDIPRDSQGNIDVVETLLVIGNPFGTFYFLSKYELISFPIISKYAREIGSIRLFNLNGEDWKVDNVPLLKSVVSKPKDLCIFLASTILAYKCLNAPDIMETSNLLKLVSNVGKIILIPFGDIMHKNKQLALLAFLDVATQNAGLFAYLLKRGKDEQARFDDPTKY